MKRSLKLSRLSEIVIKPSTSTIYVRLLFVIDTMVFILVTQTSMAWLAKLLITLFLMTHFQRGLKQGRCGVEISEIRLKGKAGIELLTPYGIEPYDRASILISNSLFQLVLLISVTKNTHLILFNDQVSDEHLRLLHFKISCFEL